MADDKSEKAAPKKTKPKASATVKGKRETHSDLIAKARARRAGKG